MKKGNKTNIKVLSLDGSPRERGLKHGRELKPLIHEIIERYKYMIKYFIKKDPNQVINLFLEKTNFLDAIKKNSPHLLEEIEGIAEGCGLDFKEIFAMHLLAHDEKWWLMQNLRIPENCSSFGCIKEKNHPTLMGQNMDLFNIFEGLEVLLHIKYPDTQKQALILTHAGFLAECGMNNYSVGICCNGLTRYLKNSTQGLPVTFIVRMVLEQASLKKAVEFVTDIKHASGQNYLLGGKNKIVSLECSANKVSEYKPSINTRRIYHTNHPLVNDDLISPPIKPMGKSTTFDRFDYLKYRLRKSSKIVGVETFKKIFSSHFGPICVHHSNQPISAYTFSSVIYTLSASPCLHITVGPPCSARYEKFEF